MRPGDCAAWPAGDSNGHCFRQPHRREARFLVVGSKAPHEVATYSDLDFDRSEVNRTAPPRFLYAATARPGPAHRDWPTACRRKPDMADLHHRHRRRRHRHHRLGPARPVDERAHRRGHRRPRRRHRRRPRRPGREGHRHHLGQARLRRRHGPQRPRPDEGATPAPTPPAGSSTASWRSTACCGRSSAPAWIRRR